MSSVTHILSAIEQGDGQAADRLLPLVYDELRKLAAAKLAQENPGQTLQATALVHETYIRLVDQSTAQQWDNSRHFFSAAAESMRRILVERARHKQTLKRGGEGRRRVWTNMSRVANDRITFAHNWQGEVTEIADQQSTVRSSDYDELGRQIRDCVDSAEEDASHVRVGQRAQ